MISADVLSASNCHVAARRNLELIRRLDREGGVRTSVSLQETGFWWVRRSTVESSDPLRIPANSSQAGLTLPNETRERLLELSRLESDWDSYGALPASNRAIAAAGTLVSRIIARTGPQGVPHEIMPIADGGISLEWRYPTVELGLNAYPDGGWSYLLIERNEEGRHATEGYDLSDDDALALVFDVIGPALA